MKTLQIAIVILSAVASGTSAGQSAPAHEVVGAVDQPQAVSHIDGSSSESVQASGDLFSEAELDQMLAPIALYPDSVLTHILIASTYPLEIVEAERWRMDNPDLEAEEALNAVEDQPWDASVKALVAFPHLLTRMSQDLRWTQSLGDAFLLSEAMVMDRVQVLRNDAYSAGELRSSPEVQVVVEKQIIEKVERRTIIIEPVVERVVYLPHYDTRRVYGSWRWAAYPPVYWDPFHTSRHHHYSVYWGPAVRVAPSFYIGAFHWSQRQVVVVNHVHYRPAPVFYRSRSLAHHHSAAHWSHKPRHRRGVAYHPVYHARHAHRPEYREYRPARRPQYRDLREHDRPAYRAPQRRDDSRRDFSPRNESRAQFDASPPRSVGRNADAERRAGLQSFEAQREARARSRIEAAPQQRNRLESFRQQTERSHQQAEESRRETGRQAERRQEAVRQPRQQIAQRDERRESASRARSERVQESPQPRHGRSRSQEQHAAPPMRESHDPGGNRQSWRGDNRR